MMDDDDYDNDNQQWWEDVWLEREAEIESIYGISHPPNQPMEWVQTLKMTKCPGACIYFFRPHKIYGTNDYLDNWIYMTGGLSQPKSREKKPYKKYELAIEVSEPNNWVNGLLHMCMDYAVDADINEGDRIMCGFFEDNEEKIIPFLGETPKNRNKATLIKGVLLWERLNPKKYFITPQSSFKVVMMTCITETEWFLAREAGAERLQLLLCCMGIGQCSLPFREDATASNKGEKEWGRIQKLSSEEVTKELTKRFTENY